MITIVAAAALGLGYLLGRLRPWQALGNWAEDQVRFVGSWARGGTTRQAVVVLAHGLTRPRTSWRIARTPPREQMPTPVRDPRWPENRTSVPSRTWKAREPPSVR